MQKQSRFIETDEKSLKQVYPNVENRANLAKIKLKDCSLKNPYVVRIQPISKYFKQGEKAKFITLLMEGSTLIAQINANVHKKMKLSSKKALFLTCGRHLICNRKTVSEIAQLGKQQDGIVYLGYADQDPFGYMQHL